MTWVITALRSTINKTVLGRCDPKPESLMGPRGCALRGLTLELSGLRRNHARCGAAICHATVPQISPSFRAVRSMSPYLQPRIIFVLRRAHLLCASSRQETIAVFASLSVRHPGSNLIEAFSAGNCLAWAVAAISRDTATCSIPYKPHRPHPMAGRLPSSRCI
jgi:hypothetical protein